MAQTVKIILEDDLDGGPAEETVRFGLDGAQYEIDLSESNARRLRDHLAAFVGAARRAGSNARTGRPTAPTRQATPADREHGAAVRAWARANGHKVSDRGRISAEILTAYEQRS